MIDSMYEDLFSTHHAIVELLLKALEEMLQISNPLWMAGTIETWLRMVFPVQQTDTCSCGALMLASVKHCAKGFEAKLHLETIAKVRKNLFLEDVNSDFNEVRENLELISYQRDVAALKGQGLIQPADLRKRCLFGVNDC